MVKDVARMCATAVTQKAPSPDMSEVGITEAGHPARVIGGDKNGILIERTEAED